jgi:predicted MFS family arabinose efflux permease
MMDNENNNMCIVICYCDVFGNNRLGAECISVSQSTYVARVFHKLEISFAFGLTISISRIGSSGNMIVEPRIAEAYGLSAALWFGSIICLVSLLMAFICRGMLAFGEKRKPHELVIKESEKKGLSWRHILLFPATLWVIFFIVLFYYCAVFPFMSVIVGFLREKYNMSTDHAALLGAIPYGISAIGSPFVGVLIDRVGGNPFFVTLASVMLALTHFMFLSTDSISPIFILVVLGLSYSILASSLWSMVSKCVPKSTNSTAFGVAYAIQNCGLALTALSIGALIDAYDYDAAILFFLVFAVIATSLAVVLVLMDLHRGWTLSQRKKEE